MALIQWRDEFCTGISGVDHEHEELIDQINAVYGLLDSGSDRETIINCLGDIYGSISAHFALEERWMEQNDYDHYRQHREDHEHLLDDLGDITDEFEETEDFDADKLQKKLNDWFLVHFQTHDVRLHKYVNSIKNNK